MDSARPYYDAMRRAKQVGKELCSELLKPYFFCKGGAWSCKAPSLLAMLDTQ